MPKTTTRGTKAKTAAGIARYIRKRQPASCRLVRKDTVNITHFLFYGLRIASELNVRGSEHWTKAHSRRKTQKQAIELLLAQKPPPQWAIGNSNILISMTRWSARRLDPGDNINASFKMLRDSVCLWLGISDSSEEIAWLYRQPNLGSDKTPLVSYVEVSIFNCVDEGEHRGPSPCIVLTKWAHWIEKSIPKPERSDLVFVRFTDDDVVFYWSDDRFSKEFLDVRLMAIEQARKGAAQPWERLGPRRKKSCSVLSAPQGKCTLFLVWIVALQLSRVCSTLKPPGDVNLVGNKPKTKRKP